MFGNESMQWNDLRCVYASADKYGPLKDAAVRLALERWRKEKGRQATLMNRVKEDMKLRLCVCVCVCKGC